MTFVALFKLVFWISHYCTQLFSSYLSTALRRCEADSAQLKDSPESEETCRKKKQYDRQNRAARDSGVAPSLEDRDSGFSLTDGYCAALLIVPYLYSAVNTCTTTTAGCCNCVSLCRLGKSKDVHALKSIRNKATSGVMYSFTFLTKHVSACLLQSFVL